MSSESIDMGHGHSPAAWISVTVMLVAFAAGTLFFVLDMPLYVVISAGVVLIGALLWPILAKMGYGVGGAKYTSKGH
jgi:hypothetical protein